MNGPPGSPSDHAEVLAETLAELARARAELADLEESTVGRLVQALRQRKGAVIPRGSRREKAWWTVAQRLRFLAGRLTRQRGSLPLERLERTRRRPRVLALSAPGGASRRYRVEHLVETLGGLGGDGLALSWDAPLASFSPERLAGAFELLVLHRTPATPAIRALIEGFRAAGRPVVYETDDLVFDPDLSLRDLPGVRRMISPGWQRGQRAALELADAAFVSTEPLRERVEGLGKPAYLLENAFSLAMQVAAGSCRPRRPDGLVVLGYASGSPTHDQDLAVAAPALAALLERRPEVALDLIGPLSLPPVLEPHRERIRRHEAVPWWELPRLLVELDLNLAPLALTNPFARCKSAIKHLEAALVGVPTLASPSPAFARAIEPGRDGFLAADDEWEARLEELVADAGLRREVGARARERVLAEDSLDARAPRLGAALRELGLELAEGQLETPPAQP